MALRVRVAAFLAALAVVTVCCGAVCPPCTCSVSAAGVVQSVSCTHMSMDMYGIPSDIPATTERLDLSGHGIKRIDRNDLSDLPRLVNLTLANNKISSVDALCFAPLLNLRQLDLHDNDIASVNRDTFSGLAKLQRLDLSGNKISHVSRETFTALPALSFLNLAGNPLQCDCSIGWMVLGSLPALQAPLTPPLTCDSPAHLAGRHVSSLSLDDLGCVVPGVSAVETRVTAYKGESVLLSCSVTGAPAADLVWFHGEEVVTTDAVELLGNGSLSIDSMEAEFAGVYTCVSSNMAGSGNASITVSYLGVIMPRIRIPPSHTHAFPGEDVILRCMGDDNTNSYRWLFSGQPLVSSDRLTIIPGVGLNISHVAESDSGLYTCVAVGTEGSVEASAQLSVTGALISCQGLIDANTMEEIRSMVMFAFNHSSLSNVSSPHQLLRRLKLPDNASIEFLAAADIFQEAVQTVRDSHRGSSDGGVPALSECEINLLAELSGCLQHSPAPDCSDVCHLSRYRSVDGSCNNWAQPTWGMADVPFQRLLPPAYEDGLGLPVGWSGGRPSARTVSQRVIRAHQVESDEHVTHMLMQFGQFLDHDIDLAPGTPADIAFSSGAMCDSQCSNSAPCFPIPVEEGDPRLTAQCIPFTRSGGVCGSGPSSLLIGSSAFYREQINTITSYVDGSQVYGSTGEHAKRLRNPARPGWLLEGIAGPTGKPMLPFDTFSLIECSTGVHSGRSQCFLAGDVRTNEQVVLTTMHTLFFREHNRVASFLSHINPHWDQEKVYQETRRLVIAELQHIVYSEYLPTILGPSGMQLLGEYRGYDPDVNPTIANAFATAAYRFGHGQILPFFQRLNESYLPRPEGPLQLRHAFFAPYRLLEEGGIDPLLRGLLASPGKKRAPYSGLNSNLTEALFEQANDVGLDLAALNIQRGRDHGLPSYLHWRGLCNLSTSNPLTDIGNATVQTKLMEVYDDEVGKIDLWVGGLLESLEPGAQLGPTFSCIIAEQFKRLREGDRFWYERRGQFSPDQLLALKRTSLSRIICDNADNITRVPRHAFALQPVEEFSECSDLPAIDLNLWTDCTDCSPSVQRRSVLMSTTMEEEVQQLRAALDRLQRSESSSCLVNGVRYSHLEEWEMGACTLCSCKLGAVSCHEKSC